MKKILLIIIVIIIIIIVSGGVFYGGIKYAQTKIFQRFQQLGASVVNPVGERIRNQGGANFITGEIISKDDKSITIKLRDGGSKIVFWSGSTEITKSAKGSVDNLQTGAQVVINGNQNTDGSITASSVQIR